MNIMYKITLYMLISIVCLTNHHIVVYGQEEEEQDGCTRLAKDLQCSACSIFIDEYFNAVARAPSALFKEGTSTKNLWHDGASKVTAAKVYEQRIRAIYKKHAPKKLRRVFSLMKKYSGDEYNLYLRICDKYSVTAEPEFENPDDEEEEDDEEEKNSWKYQVATEAMEIVKGLPTKNGMQWAISGDEGKRKFADFNKLMSSGGTMNNLSMGGNVADDLNGCFNHLAETFNDDLATVVFHSEKPFSFGLHKKFCKKHEYCGRKKKKKSEL